MGAGTVVAGTTDLLALQNPRPPKNKIPRITYAMMCSVLVPMKK
jgi:hypothetical protein